MQSQSEFARLLVDYTPFDNAEARHLEAILAFVARHPDYHRRSCLTGHVTASAWVLHPSEPKVLLTHHRKLKQWFQLGGHIEEDVSVQAAALREAREESGITDVELLLAAPLDVDAHTIPGNAKEPEHTHFDVRFLVRAQAAEFVVGDESNALAWVPLEAAEPRLQEASMQRMREKSLRYLSNPKAD